MKKTYLMIIPLAAAMVLSGCTRAPVSSESGGPTSTSSAPVTSSLDPSSTTSSTGPTSADPSSTTSSIPPSSTTIPGDYSEAFSGIMRIYYHNDAGNESTLRIYAWCDGVDGQEYEWDGFEDGYGVYKDFDVGNAPYAETVTDRFYFIIKYPATWAGQTPDITVKFVDFPQYDGTDGRKHIDVYAAEAEGNNVDCYLQKADALGDRFASFKVTPTGLSVVGTGAVASYTLYAFDETYYRLAADYQKRNMKNYVIKEGQPNQASFTIPLDSVNPHITYRIDGVFSSNTSKTKSKYASCDALYDTAFFNSYIYTGNDLGVKYGSSHTEFRIWAPTSARVEVNLYTYGTPSAYAKGDPMAPFYDFKVGRYEMSRQSGGVYSCAIEDKGDLHGTFYTYTLYYNGAKFETPDPYCTACGLNGLRSAIVDFSRTNPSGWDNLSFPSIGNKANYLSVYEVHMRDFTASDTWNGHAKKGSYEAFHEAGTTYNGVTTGFDHLKELGVNAVQLLPVFDQDNDERTVTKTENGQEVVVSEPGYNWGYNPSFYNCVEGAYSSDPYSPTARIEEYKAMILDLANNGMRTIMDVVYNHVSSVSKNALSVIAPKYFFRYNDEGALIDDSGCGNTFNSTRAMGSNFIVNSVKFWAKEYKVKGFRFDLMGCIETTTMRQLKDELYAIDPDIVVYGEGWTGGGSHATSPSNEDNTYRLLTDKGKGGVGVFNDCGRDGTKGNTKWADVVPSDAAGTFLGNGSRNSQQVDNVYNCLTQLIGENRWKKDSGIPTAANQTVNYVACHDNYTLYDSLNYMYNGAANCAKDSESAMLAAQAAMGFVEFSQGIAFLHGGDEFFRTKVMNSDDELFDDLVESYKHATNGKDSWIEGDGIRIDDDHWLVRNSYKYGDNVNAFDWSRKARYENLYKAVKDLVHLRNDLMGNVLGQTQAQIDAGQTYCWSYNDLCGESSGDQPILAGGAQGIKDGKQYYAFLGGRASSNPSIGIGNGRYKVVYANKYHTVGATFDITNNLMGVQGLEFCVIAEA